MRLVLALIALSLLVPEQFAHALLMISGACATFIIFASIVRVHRKPPGHTNRANLRKGVTYAELSKEEAVIAANVAAKFSRRRETGA